MIWPFDGQRGEARRLKSDALAIVKSAQHSPSSVSVVANVSAESIRESLIRANDTAHLNPAISHFRMLHGEARRSNERDKLTAYSLVIIYLSALRLENDKGRPAIDTIDRFIAEHGTTASSG